MQSPIGPRTITKVRQVAIPAKLMAEVGLDVGSEVYFSLNTDRRIEVIPAEGIGPVDEARS
jgi:antitoxin component of MazEF toxin-antitoxin module